MNKRILLIEDDPFHRESIESRIRAKWKDINFEFEPIANEKAFGQRFNELAARQFDLVIIDQMIPYTSDEDESDNRGALDLDAFRGGTRCYERLRKEPPTKAVPVVFLTILDQASVPEGVAYVKKTGDAKMVGLLDIIAKALALP
ncbi:MAG: hypothetical protein AAB403_06130 [Planctomycetota bacterium]